MAKTVKLSLEEPFLTKALAGQVEQLLTEEKVEEKDTVNFTNKVSAIVTEALTVTISRAAVTISTGKEGELPYALSNKDTFAKASGYESFEDLKNQLEENGEKLPVDFTLIRWNASAMLDESGKPKAKASTATSSAPRKTAAQKAKEKEEADRIAEIDQQIDEADVQIAEGQKALAAENDPLLKKIIEDDLQKLEEEKAELVKSKATGA